MPRRLTVPLIVAAGLFMDILDSTVIATSLPQMARSFGVEPVRLSLAITAYLISVAVFLPVSGYLADRFGTRTIFCSAIVIFTISSVLCGMSQSLPELTIARVFQGIGGSMMTPVGRLLILRSVEKHELVAAMAYFTIPAMIAPICGPLVGGYITTYYNWRWIFFINVPIGAIGIVLALTLVPNLREAERPRLDLKGWILAGIALVGLIFGFETLGRSGLPLPIALLIVAVGIAATVLYLRHAPRVSRPILDLSLLRIETFRTAVVGGVSLRLALGSMQLFMPLMLQLGYGLTAFASGSISLFAAGGAMASKPFSPIIFRRFGFRNVLMWNSYIGALTFVIFALAITPATPHIVLVLVIFLNGFSRSVQLTAINVIAYADVEQRRLSASSTLVSVFQQFSVATGVAIGAAILHALTAATGGASSHLTVYRYGFMICAVMTLGSQYWFRALSEKAGAAVSGHRLQAAVEPDEAPALGVTAADAVLSEGKATQPSGPSASSG